MIDFKTEIITGVEREDLLETADEFTIPAWPEFMRKDPVSNRHWSDIYRCFPAYQFVMTRTDTGAIIAAANSVALRFEGTPEELPETGWDWAMEESVKQHNGGIAPNLQCAIQIVVDVAYKGVGLAGEMVLAMKAIGRRHGLKALIAPVRPNNKHRWPTVSIDDYITWRREDGLPFDPWLRAHERLGAKLIKPCHEAMTIPGTVSDWRSWTGLAFAGTGLYLVPKALVPVKIDLEQNHGLYVEPNVWMWHPQE
ncbi:MAG TPA: GNAT family N-acetyltransferase [candidate division Zixibacteria bacterium]|nr:GNAT family N-acetyltransferase [candidate division Zixibacteria bacterium]